MFKLQVPYYLFSVAVMVTIPSAANPGKPLRASGKQALDASVGKNGARTAVSKKNKITLEPDKQGMHFVKVYTRANREDLLVVKHRSEVPFYIIDSVFRRANLPAQLKYLAVVESELKPTALSSVGAKGPWQLMPGTARLFGLKVNKKVDERTDYYKSTRAAAKYLRDLHRRFGDWLLVMAAYNGGPTPVYRAIRKSHSKDFWTLQQYLPPESRTYVKKFIATTWYFEGSESTAAAKPEPIAQPAVLKTPATAATTQASTLNESTDAKFTRLMRQSAASLKDSHELLGSAN